jgi:diguanylate cyclase
MEVAPAADTLDDLVRLGVRLAIDDFGTGYSSLSYLKRFPVEALKIDKAFVAGLGRDPEDEAIVAAVVALGHGLGLRVCAEGVETAAQAALLGRLGCDTGQGYHFAPPLPATAFADALDGERGAASADQGREIALAGAV